MVLQVITHLHHKHRVQKEISLLKDALFEASDCIKEMQQSLKVSSKKHIVDLVTEADLKSEEILMKAIKKHFPDDGIISEESETIKSSTKRSWIIDPLDGTVNYANNIPQVAITLMLLEDTKPTQAYVLDIYNDVLYEGYKGSGSYKNGEKLSIKKDTTIQKSIIATGFPYDRVFNSKDYMKTFEAVLKSC